LKQQLEALELATVGGTGEWGAPSFFVHLVDLDPRHLKQQLSALGVAIVDGSVKSLVRLLLGRFKMSATLTQLHAPSYAA
jgi:hypothetical protein